MKILPEPLAFQWDKGNLEKNFNKHNVTVSEAEELFSSDPFIVREDARHGDIEKRFQALGKTKTGRKFFVAFMLRDRKVRVISVRDMTHNEEAAYERLESNS